MESFKHLNNHDSLQAIEGAERDDEKFDLRESS